MSTTQTKWAKRHSVQKFTRLASRLSDMSAEEILHRLELRLRSIPVVRRKHFETYTRNSKSCANQFWQSVSQNNVKKYLSRDLADRFFFGPQDKERLVQAFRQHAPDEIEKISALGAALREQGIDVLGLPFVAAREPIDWQADPKSNRRLWTAGLLDEATAIANTEGDVKYVWERNRHQFIPLLGQAYWFTDDPEYAATAEKLIDEWIEQNPAGTGVNWCSHLEVAVRVISWLWTMPYLMSWEGLGDGFIERWLKSTAQHYYHLSQNLSKFTDPTNHLIGETAALWLLSHVFKELPDARANEAAASALLSAELERQIAADGVNIEQATSYHRFVLDFYLQVMVLKRQAGDAFSAAHEARIALMLDFCAALGGASGIAPMIGDSDDARGMPLLELTGWDFRDSLELGAAVFDREDWLQDNRGPGSAAIWIAGSVAEPKHDPIQADAAPMHVKYFDEGGYVFVRQFNGSVVDELIFDCGPLGLQPNAAHGHADALSIMIRLDGYLLMADPGTGTYFDSQSIRDHFRKTACHNTITVDNLDQTDIFDTFKWVNPMNVQPDEPIVHDDICIISAEHDGYSRLQNPVNHRRTIVALKNGGWLIIDNLEGSDSHAIDRWFNFRPGVELQPLNDHKVRATDPATGYALNLDFHHDTQVICSEDGLWSTQYGRWDPSNKIRATSRMSGATTLITSISARRPGPHDIDDESFRVSTRSGRQIVLARPSSRGSDAPEELIAINPDKQKINLAGDVTTNGSIVYLRWNESREIASAILTGRDTSLSANRFNLSCENDQNATTFLRQRIS